MFYIINYHDNVVTLTNFMFKYLFVGLEHLFFCNLDNFINFCVYCSQEVVKQGNKLMRLSMGLILHTHGSSRKQ